MHQLTIGNDCAISWNCQFLDEDYHEIQYEGKKEKNSNSIKIGDRVWIGSNVSIHKGAVIPRGCVVASNSVVKAVFDEENVLIAGNPAKVVKRSISW
jgi:acetyltransferase-like isoleucine patch superfamily enzyme